MIKLLKVSDNIINMMLPDGTSITYAGISINGNININVTERVVEWLRSYRSIIKHWFDDGILIAKLTNTIPENTEFDTENPYFPEETPMFNPYLVEDKDDDDADDDDYVENPLYNM